MRSQIHLTRTRSYTGINWDYLVVALETETPDYKIVKKSKTLEGAARGLREYEHSNSGSVGTIIYIGECTDDA